MDAALHPGRRVGMWRRRVVLSCHLGCGVGISKSLGCTVGMSFSKCNSHSVPSSQTFTEGEAEEREMLF